MKNRPGPEIPKTVDFYRASHLTVCDRCGKIYQQHDFFPVADTWGPMYLYLICNGDYVKL